MTSRVPALIVHGGAGADPGGRDRLRNGAVASVSGVRNPITLARRILEDGHHSLFVGPGAAARVRALGVNLCDPEELITEHQRRRLASVQAGTVGAVAL